MMGQTATGSDLAEWLARETERAAEIDRRNAEEERERASRARCQQINQCNDLLAKWGCPLVITEDDADFPVVEIGGKRLWFTSPAYPGRDHLQPASGEDIWIYSPYDLVQFLSRKQEPQTAPLEEQEAAAEVETGPAAVPETYCHEWFNSAATAIAWVNERAAQDYVLWKFEFCPDGDGLQFLVVMERRQDDGR